MKGADLLFSSLLFSSLLFSSLLFSSLLFSSLLFSSLLFSSLLFSSLLAAPLMSILVTCPGCQAQIHAADSRAGGRVECDFCGAETPVPSRTSGLSSTHGGTLWGINYSTIAALVGAMLLLGVVWMILLPAMTTPRDFSRRTICTSNLKQIVFALHQYNHLHGSFPPAFVADANGKPLYSWRVLLLPYLEESTLFTAFDKTAAWDSPQNAPLAQRDLHIFRCPSAPSTQPGTTSYVVVIDPEFAFTGADGTKIEDLRDGTSNTIVVIEVDWAIPWSAPLDPTGDELLARFDASQLGGPHAGVILVCDADTRVRTLPVTIDRDQLRARLTRAGGESVMPP